MKPLNELELYDFIKAAYPEKWPETDDDDWDKVQEFIDTLCDRDILADILGRAVMLTMPIQSQISGNYYHMLGSVWTHNGVARIDAAIKRKAKI